MRFFNKTPNIPFVRYSRLMLALSGLIISASLFFIFTRGLAFGTDFTGGVKLQYQFPKEVSEGEVRSLLSKLNLGDVSIVRYGDVRERRLVIRVSKPTGDIQNMSQIITPELDKTFGAPGVVMEQEETVGPKVGEELRKKGQMAVLVSLFCMLIFIGFRFDFYFAPGALIAVFHDVIVTLGVFAFFQFEFNLTILAAVLTIVGYSINDTIIVFDRIREHARLIAPDTVNEVVNTSINETLSRTIITSVTVFFVTAFLYFFGGETIKYFALAFMVGILTGTYSSFSIACPVYLWCYRNFPKIEAFFGRKAG